ncbi:hypothetical protein VTN49DRAFT_1657 [Thermomyces lanuginosus]|uniref:uncharacterized protein n=1 Tax=Thermomyces lanuginosus TaxID=5541 RepID=UPI003742EE1E
MPHQKSTVSGSFLSSSPDSMCLDLNMSSESSVEEHEPATSTRRDLSTRTRTAGTERTPLLNTSLSPLHIEGCELDDPFFDIDDDEIHQDGYIPEYQPGQYDVNNACALRKKAHSSHPLDADIAEYCIKTDFDYNVLDRACPMIHIYAYRPYHLIDHGVEAHYAFLFQYKGNASVFLEMMPGTEVSNPLIGKLCFLHVYDLDSYEDFIIWSGGTNKFPRMQRFLDHIFIRDYHRYEFTESHSGARAWLLAVVEHWTEVELLPHSAYDEVAEALEMDWVEPHLFRRLDIERGGFY